MPATHAGYAASIVRHVLGAIWTARHTANRYDEAHYDGGVSLVEQVRLNNDGRPGLSVIWVRLIALLSVGAHRHASRRSEFPKMTLLFAPEGLAGVSGA